MHWPVGQEAEPRSWTQHCLPDRWMEGPHPLTLRSSVYETRAAFLVTVLLNVCLAKPGFLSGSNILHKTVLAFCSLIAVKIHSFIHSASICVVSACRVLGTPHAPQTRVVKTNHSSACWGLLRHRCPG